MKRKKPPYGRRQKALENKDLKRLLDISQECLWLEEVGSNPRKT